MSGDRNSKFRTSPRARIPGWFLQRGCMNKSQLAQVDATTSQWRWPDLVIGKNGFIGLLVMGMWQQPTPCLLEVVCK